MDWYRKRRKHDKGQQGLNPTHRPSTLGRVVLMHQDRNWTGLPIGRTGRAIKRVKERKSNQCGRRKTRDTLIEETEIGKEKLAARNCRENNEAKGMW